MNTRPELTQSGPIAGWSAICALRQARRSVTVDLSSDTGAADASGLGVSSTTS